jgi:DNA repair photolyase
VPNDFDDVRSNRGTFEWADWSENIQKGCAHGCLYCYAAHNAIVKFKSVKAGEWQIERPTKRAGMLSYPKREGVGMFPTAHDITPNNIDECIRVLTLMLQAGNKILIVTKPHTDCVLDMCMKLRDFKDQIMFRFTIGTLDDGAAKFWEPEAPLPIDRIAALSIAHGLGFRTSVSMEPFLSSVDDTITLVDVVKGYVTDSIWIGLMNKIDDRVLEARPDVETEIEKIKKYQTPAEIVRLVDTLDGNPLIFWKDSIKDMIASIK